MIMSKQKKTFSLRENFEVVPFCLKVSETLSFYVSNCYGHFYKTQKFFHPIMIID